jgi:glycosyltransferase involved in cell wall biosynthesis
VRIAILSDGIPPFMMGGMQKHSKLIGEYLAKLGHKVTMFHYSENAQNAAKAASFFSEEALLNLCFEHFVYEDSGKLPGHYLRAQRKMSEIYLGRLLNMPAFDFIYAKGFMGWALLQRRDELKISSPVGLKLHGMNMFQKQPNIRGEITKYLFRKKVRDMMNKADYVFSYGGKITSIINQELSNHNDRVIEIPSGITNDWLVNPELIENSSGVIKILFVGRYDRLKGLPELYAAIPELKMSDKCIFTFVGPIPKSQQLQKENVKYLGVIYDENELKDVYDEHDVLVCPSISEGMPNVIMEGMARGLVIIATDVGATNILVSEKNGQLLKTAKAKDIAVAIDKICMLTDMGMLKLKKQSRETINDFVWSKIALELNKWLERLK